MNDPVLMPACATDGPTAASNFDPGTEMNSDPGNQSEQFDVSAFCAMLEQKSEKTSEKVVVNLDDYYRQQRDKKRQDLKKKSEAATYMRSYHARKTGKSAESLNEQFDFSDFRAMLEQKSEKTSEKVVVNLDDHYRQQRDKKRQDLKNKSEAETYRRSYHARKISKSAESLNEQLDDDSNVDCKSSVGLSIGKRDETNILTGERYGGVQTANPNLEEQSNTKHETNALNDEENEGTAGEIREPMTDAEKDSLVDNKCNSEKVHVVINLEQPADPNLEEQSNTKHETNALNDEEQKGAVVGIEELMTDVEMKSPNENECSSEKAVVHLEELADPNLEEQSNTEQDANALNDEEQKGAVVGIEELMTEVEKESPNEHECSSEKAVVHLEQPADLNLDEQSNTKQDANALNDEEEKGTVVGIEEPMTEVEMESPNENEYNSEKVHVVINLEQLADPNLEEQSNTKQDANTLNDRDHEGTVVRIEEPMTEVEMESPNENECNSENVHVVINLEQPADPNLEEQSNTKQDANALNDGDHEGAVLGIEEPMTEVVKESPNENECNSEKAVVHLEHTADPNLDEQSNTKQDNNRLNDDEEQKGAVVGIEEPMTEVEKESPNENECSSEKAVVHLEHTADPNLEEQSNTKQDANALNDEEQKGTVVGIEEPMTEVEKESPDKYECNYLRSHHKAGSANAEPSNELDACDVYDKSSEGDTIGERCETSIAVGERGIEVHPVDTILSEQKIEHDANGVNGEDHEVIGAGDSNNQDSKAIEEPTNETEKRALVENEYNIALLPRQKNAKQRKEVPSVITYVSEEVDITKIPKWKHVLVPPEREYMKVFSSCWCGN
jgi:hypothetical protein